MSEYALLEAAEAKVYADIQAAKEKARRQAQEEKVTLPFGERLAKLDTGDEHCFVCLKMWEPGDKVVTVPCGHDVHVACRRSATFCDTCEEDVPRKPSHSLDGAKRKRWRIYDTAEDEANGRVRDHIKAACGAAVADIQFTHPRYYGPDWRRIVHQEFWTAVTPSCACSAEHGGAPGAPQLAPETEVCTVCHEGTSAHFDVVLPCGHMFHKECVPQSQQCRTCRAGFTTSDLAQENVEQAAKRHHTRKLRAHVQSTSRLMEDAILGFERAEALTGELDAAHEKLDHPVLGAFEEHLRREAWTLPNGVVLFDSEARDVQAQSAVAGLERWYESANKQAGADHGGFGLPNRVDTSEALLALFDKLFGRGVVGLADGVFHVPGAAALKEAFAAATLGLQGWFQSP